MAIQIKRKFIEDQAVDSSKVDSSIALSADLASEVSRATAAEGVLTVDLASEVSRATAAEGALQSSISSEAATREAADLQHSTAIQSLQTDLAQTNSNLSSESTARGLADANLQSQIDNILSNVDPAALDSLTEVVAAFQAADSDLNNAITTLSTGNTAALNQEIADRIADVNAEQARAEAAEGVLTADLAAEVTRATAAEGVLTADLAQEVIDRQAADFAESQTRIDQDAILQDNINAEVSRALVAEGALQSEDLTFLKLDGSRVMSNDLDMGQHSIKDVSSFYNYNQGTSQNEPVMDLSGRQLMGFNSGSATWGVKIGWGTDNPYVWHNNAINPLSSEIATAQFVTDAVLAEQAARESADGIIAADLAAEVSNRIADVDAEETRAMAAENVLTVDLAAEVSRATTAEGVLTADLAAEVVRATAAEGVLQANIDVEKGRVDAILLAADADKDSFAEIVALINSVDTANDSAFASYVISNNAALAAEESARIAADGVLTADLAAEVSRATAAEGVLQANIDAETLARSQSDNNIFIAINQEISNRQAADDLKLNLSGGTMSGSINMGNNNIESANTIYTGILSTTFFVDTQTLMGTNKIQTGSLGFWHPADNASPKGSLYAGGLSQEYFQVDSAGELKLTAGTQIWVNNKVIANVADGVDAKDVATKGQLDSVESALDVRVSALEADHYLFAQQGFVLSATNISNGYIDLAHTIEPASLNMYVDRLAIHETDDYTVSVVGGVTRITFVGSLVTAGQEKLVAGDVIKAKYAYRV